LLNFLCVVVLSNGARDIVGALDARRDALIAFGTDPHDRVDHQRIGQVYSPGAVPVNDAPELIDDVVWAGNCYPAGQRR